jgi:hypothetical protein
LRRVWNLEQKTKRDTTRKIKKTCKGFRILNRKAKAAGIGVGLILAKRIKESEMYTWCNIPKYGTGYRQQKMREKMLKHLDHLIEEIRNDN